MANKKVVVWGDSVARGVVFNEERNRYVITKDNAAKIVSEKLGYEIVNRSRMGMTSADGLDTVKKDIAKGLEGDIAIIEFGGNDCDFDWKAISENPYQTHMPKTAADEFDKNIHTLIDTTSKAGFEPLLVSLPPINSDNYFDFLSRGGLSQENILKWLGDKNHIYRFHERYSMIITRIARETGCRLLDIRSAFLDLWNSTELFCLDGIHPSEKGQRFIGESIVKAIT